MLTLALDTSTNQGGVAILNGPTVLSSRIWTRTKSHTEMLTPTLETCFREAGIRARDLQRIAVGKGPGSFTGIRIAINCARTLSYALKIPVFAFDSMEILSAGAHNLIDSSQSVRLLALLNAYKNLFYLSLYESEYGSWRRTHGPDALSLGEITLLVDSPVVCVGDGYAELNASSPLVQSELLKNLRRDTSLSDFPSPEVLGRMPDTGGGKPLVWNEVQALYIRASEAEEKLRERLQK